jgi:hypothetical protein
LLKDGLEDGALELDGAGLTDGEQLGALELVGAGLYVGLPFPFPPLPDPALADIAREAIKIVAIFIGKTKMIAFDGKKVRRYRFSEKRISVVPDDSTPTRQLIYKGQLT